MGFMGGGGGGGAQSTVAPIKPVPPPAQMSASVAAMRGAKAAQVGGELDGTILAGGNPATAAAAAMRSPGEVLYGKKLTGA